MDSTWLDESSLTLGLTIGSFRFTGDDTPVISNVQTPSSSFVIKEEIERKNSIQEESGLLEIELNRVNTENRRLNEMLAEMTANYSSLRSQLLDFMTTASSEDVSASPARKRKSHSPDTIGNQMEGGSNEIACKRIKEEIRPKISKVCVRTEPSDSSLVVKDGYQWRKYGQKVTRDNPCPRAYFRCSFAPSCPVKKKVQRSAEDRSILVATYEGEHNHGNQSHQTEMPIDPIRTISRESSGTEERQEVTEACREAMELQPNLVEKMALSLANDPGFTAALATAISGRILKLSQGQNQ